MIEIDNFTAARLIMAISLGFHILFAVAGMAMPLLMIVAEWQWIRHRSGEAKALAQRWAKGTAVLFAIGAVSGTALSFELGLLWPQFMVFAGPVIGLPLSLELYAFFLEAIALGIYLYGWGRLNPWAHWLAGVVVLLSGTASGIFIVTANAWMNHPTGFDLVDGVATNIRPWEAMWNPMSFSQTLHMVLAAFAALGFVVAGIHARGLLKEPRSNFHSLAFGIALSVGGVAALIQPLSGDIAARAVAKHQPVKFAALEGQWETERGAPLRIGGLPDEEEQVTRYAIEIPKLASFLATGDFEGEVRGLKDFPRDVHPPVALVHLSFQLMVGLGILMAVIAVLGGWLHWRGRSGNWPRWYLRSVWVASPAGLIAIEAGWITTEVGRQPWIVRDIMRSADAVATQPSLVIPLFAFSALYLVLGFISLSLLRLRIADDPMLVAGPDEGAEHAA